MSNPLLKSLGARLGAFTVATVMAFSGSALAASLDETNAQVTQGAITAVVTEPIDTAKIDTAKYEEAFKTFKKHDEVKKVFKDIYGLDSAEAIEFYSNIFKGLYIINSYAQDGEICGSNEHVVFTPEELLSICIGLDSSDYNYVSIYGYEKPNSSNEIIENINSFCAKYCQFLKTSKVPFPWDYLAKVDDETINWITSAGGEYDAETKKVTKKELETLKKMSELFANLNIEKAKLEKTDNYSDELLAFIYEYCVNNDLQESSYTFHIIFVECIKSYLEIATENETYIHNNISKTPAGTRIEVIDGNIYFISQNGALVLVNTEYNEYDSLALFHRRNKVAGSEYTGRLIDLLWNCECMDMTAGILKGTMTDDEFDKELQVIIQTIPEVIDEKKFPKALEEIIQSINDYRESLKKPSNYTIMTESMKNVLPIITEDAQTQN